MSKRTLPQIGAAFLALTLGTFAPTVQAQTPPPAAPAVKAVNPADDWYAEGTRLLKQGKNFEQAVGLLEQAAKKEPENSDYILALGAAYTSRAAVLGRAILAAKKYEADTKRYKAAKVKWLVAQKDLKSPAYGWPKPEPIAPPRTEDDRRLFKMEIPDAEAQVKALSLLAWQTVDKGVALREKDEAPRRAEALNLQGWCRMLLDLDAQYAVKEAWPPDQMDAAGKQKFMAAKDVGKNRPALFFGPLEEVVALVPDDVLYQRSLGDAYAFMGGNPHSMNPLWRKKGADILTDVLEKMPIASFDPAHPEHDKAAQWADYVKGVVDELNKAGASVGGFDAAIVSDVPVGAGVSSSAALLVSTAELLLTLYPHKLLVDAMGVAKLCQKAENNFVGAPVGILDQFSSVFGVAGHALFLDCRTLAHKTVELPVSEAHILIADSGVKHQLAAGGGYRDRRAQCEEAAVWFAQKTGKHITALRDVTPDMLEHYAPEMDATLEKRARHIVYENVRVQMGADALQAGNLDAFGEMMNNTHESCRRFFENSCPEVDALVEIAQNQPGVFGAKLTGGGWGGCAVIIHRPGAIDRLSKALKIGYKERFGREVGLLPTLAAQGAEAVRLD